MLSDGQWADLSPSPGRNWPTQGQASVTIVHWVPENILFRLGNFDLALISIAGFQCRKRTILWPQNI